MCSIMLKVPFVNSSSIQFNASDHTKQSMTLYPKKFLQYGASKFSFLDSSLN